MRDFWRWFVIADARERDPLGAWNHIVLWWLTPPMLFAAVATQHEGIYVALAWLWAANITVGFGMAIAAQIRPPPAPFNPIQRILREYDELETAIKGVVLRRLLANPPPAEITLGAEGDPPLVDPLAFGTDERGQEARELAEIAARMRWTDLARLAEVERWPPERIRGEIARRIKEAGWPA